MEKSVLNNQTDICITAENLETANLNEWGKLELHLLDQAAVVVPGEMNVLELLRTATALQNLAASLVSALGTACPSCAKCTGNEPCLYKGWRGRDDESISYDDNPDLSCAPESWLAVLCDTGLCMYALDEMIQAGEVVYTGMN